jgi:AcrR family transcriptional regulator
MPTHKPLKLDLASLTKEQELYDSPMTEKQKSILSAAEKLFAEVGYSETSTASIAREAGVTEKTLFKHFPTKMHLWRRVLFPIIFKTVVPLQMKIVRKILHTDHKNFRDFYESLALDRWSTAKTLGSRIKFLIGEISQNDPLRSQLHQLMLKNVWPELLKNIEKYQKSGELRQDISAEDIARLQIMTIIGNALLRGFAAPSSKYNDAHDAKILSDMIFKGIQAR